MRVLLLLSGNDVGGAERAAAQLACALLKRGDDVRVAGPPRDDYPVPLGDLRTETIALDPRDRLRAPIAVRHLRRLVRRWRPDVIYAAHRWPTRLATWATPDRDFPVVYHAQSLVEPRPFSAWGDATIAVSDAVRDRIVEQGADPARVTVIPNAADQEHPDSRAIAETRRRIDEMTSVAALTVVAAGRLVPGKGFEVLIRAVAALPETRLVLVGDGPTRPELERLIGQLPAGRAAITGWVPDARPWLAVADVVVVPSDRYPEGMPLVIAEAMALSKPVIGTRLSGIPEIVQDGTTGIVVAPGDVDELRTALRRLATDDGLRAALARRSREVARERFSIEVVSRRILDVLDTAVH